QILDPRRVRFLLHNPWPDFLTYYGTTASGVGWIVPRTYVERVGDDGFKKAPVGAGPYRFVSFNPGVELVAEAYEGYWRKMPAVKRLGFRSVPDEATRMGTVKRGGSDIPDGLRGPDAEEGGATPGRTPRGGPRLKGGGPDRQPVARLHPAVGSEVAVGGPACAACRQPRARSQGVQRRGVSRIRPAGAEHHPPRLRVLLGAAAVSPRSGAGEAAPGRGALSEAAPCPP